MKPLFLAACLWGGVPAFSAFIGDPNMFASDYGNAAISAIGGASSTAISTGLDRQITLSTPAPLPPGFVPGSIQFSEVNVTHVWTPSVNGTIFSIDYYLDTNYSPAGPNDLFGFVFRQGSVTTSINVGPATNGMRTGSWTGTLTGSTPVYFGYVLASNSIPFGASFQSVASLDNFCVIVNVDGGCAGGSSGPGTPEPASIAMFGSGLTALGLWRRVRR